MSQQVLPAATCRLLPIVIVTLALASSASAFQMAASPVPLSQVKLKLDEKKQQYQRDSQCWKKVNSKLSDLNRSLDKLNISSASFDEVVTVLQTQRIVLPLKEMEFCRYWLL